MSMSSLLFCLKYVLVTTAVLQLLCEDMSSAGSRTDRTLMPHRNGSTVVRAVIAKIETSNIFNRSQWWVRNNDRPLFMLFLRQMAYVETADGNRTAQGGIWNIAVNVLNVTRRRVCPDPQIRKSIYLKVAINWCNIEYANMSVPMYSGLAAALYVDGLINMNSANLPANPRSLHMLWHHFHWERNNAQVQDTWITTVKKLKNTERCSVKSDIVFVVDSSISITPADFNIEKDVIRNLTKQLISTTVDNRIGIVLIGNKATVHQHLGTTLNESTRNDFLQNISEIPHLQQLTNTADGLCKLTTQHWRNDSGVLRLAIVLTDGQSNRHQSVECGNLNAVQMANMIHKKHRYIVVFAIGIGRYVNATELSLIASKRHLFAELAGYSTLNSMPDTFHYQICSTMSSQTTTGSEEQGTLEENEIIRLVLDYADDEGVTVRLCVRNGSITFYISQDVTPSQAVNDYQTTIAPTDRLAISCTTTYHTPGTYTKRKRQQQSQSSTLYLSIEGHDKWNAFSLQSGDGNVIFDVNECERSPSPCHKSATCYNTDGSFYCECLEGFEGDGFKCTSFLFELLVFLVPSVVLGGLLTVSFILLILMGLCMNCRRHNPEPNKQQPGACKSRNRTCKLKKTNTVAATNRLALSTSL